MEIIKKISNDEREFISNKNSKEYIVIHHTGSKSTLKNIINFFLRPDYLSIHYVVGKDGSVTQLVKDNDVAFHAGVSSWGGKTNLNYYSIGIEIHSDGYDFTEHQISAVSELCKHLMSKYSIPKENVLKHADIAPQRKWDVGPNFYMPKFGSWEGFQNSLIKDDLSDYWKIAIDIGITNGERPKDSVTREECAAMILRGMEENGYIYPR